MTIEAIGVPPDVLGARQQKRDCRKAAPAREPAGSGQASVRQKFLDCVAGPGPFPGQFDQDPGSAETSVPGDMEDNQKAKRERVRVSSARSGENHDARPAQRARRLAPPDGAVGFGR
jgi:hypothetical protein